jgi:thymidine kinase
MSGYLEIIVGPMFSGKTTYLVNLYNQFQNDSISTIAINYIEDKRYSDTKLSTHDMVSIPCIWASNMGDAIDQIDLETTDVVLINEGQFFPDLYVKVKHLVEKYGKHVYVCGLDGDFKRNKFGAILDLIPIADDVRKLYSQCANCPDKALFSHRITKESSQKIIGASNYIALCRKCYLDK